jgi:hypothetical protein
MSWPQRLVACFALIWIVAGAHLRAEEKPSSSRLPRDKLLVYRGEKNEVLPVRTTDDWLKRRREIVAGMQSWAGSRERRSVAIST